MKEILLNDSFTDSDIERLKSIIDGYKIVTRLEDLEKPEELEILFGWNKQFAPILEGKNNLKWVQTFSAGVNSLPLERMAELDIQLSNASGAHGGPISESVYGFLLSYLRNTFNFAKDKEVKEWSPIRHIQELSTKTVMLVGTGSVGQSLAKIAQAFGARTIGINRSGSTYEHFDEIYKQEDIKDHIAEADIVMTSLPETAQTVDFFNKEVFNAMKPGTIFINVGRGSAVIDEDLLEALDSGQVEHAFLDTFRQEPLDTTHVYWEREDVFISPHSTAKREDYNAYIIDVFEENFNAFVKDGKIVRNIVDYERGY